MMINYEEMIESYIIEKYGYNAILCRVEDKIQTVVELLDEYKDYVLPDELKSCQEDMDRCIDELKTFNDDDIVINGTYLHIAICEVYFIIRDNKIITEVYL